MSVRTRPPRERSDADATNHARSRVAWLDAGTLATYVALIGWTFVAAADEHRDAWPWVASLAAAAASFVVARLLSGLSRIVVPLVVVAIGTAVFLAFSDEVLSSAPRVGPFGYSSITGAFFLQCAFGALMLLGSHRPLWPIGILAAAVFGAVMLGTETRAALILLPVLGVPAIFARRPRWAYRVVVAFGLAAALALAGSIWLGATYRGDRPSSLQEVIDATISTRRQALWYDAIQITIDHPLTGVGPDGFALHSPVARSDPDEPWAHNEFLQSAADQGVPGASLLVTIFVLGFVRLSVAAHAAASERRSVVVALGGAALAALAIHACIEYVLQRPAVPAVAAALVGAAIGPFGGKRGRLARP